MPKYVYECNKCGYIAQFNEKPTCSCGCGDDSGFEHECGGSLNLKCHCFSGNCAIFDDEDIDIYDMDDSTEGMSVN